jgi:hypothetical protein
MAKLESWVHELEQRSAKPSLLGWRSHPVSGSLPTDEVVSRAMIVDYVPVLDSDMLSLLRDNSFDGDGVVQAQVAECVLN